MEKLLAVQLAGFLLPPGAWMGIQGFIASSLSYNSVLALLSLGPVPHEKAEVDNKTTHRSELNVPPTSIQSKPLVVIWLF